MTSQENETIIGMNIPYSEDPEYSSILEIVRDTKRILRRIEEHAKTCTCCREVLEEKKE